MILNIYKATTNICYVNNYNWFFYPLNKLEFNSLSDLPYESKGTDSIDLSRRLEPEYTNEILSYQIKKGISLGISSMYLSPYFNHPIYGYCTCNKVLNDYLKKQQFKTLVCNCIHEIEFFGKCPLEMTFEEERLSAERSHFPEGFNEILFKDFILFHGQPIYLISSLNVMDVYQTSNQVFDVGITVNYIEFIRDKRSEEFRPNSEVSDEDYIINYSNKWLNALNDYTKLYFEQNKDLYLKKCVPVINHWIQKGLISKSDFFVHLYTSYYRNSKFPGLCEDRFYILESTYKSIDWLNWTQNGVN